jgi:FKBP-type peptidyl-prolyl cis-trans isomerase FkpA/FKBP-type peptidyl-prolyl cis-trans isomerase FklB
MKKLVLIAVLTTPLACSKGGDVKLETQSDRVSYMIGQQLGTGIKNQQIEINPTVIGMSIRHVVEGKESLLSEEEMRKVMEDLQKDMMAKAQSRNEEEAKKGEENKQTGAKFLEENKTKEGVKTTASGLQYKVINQGSGKKPAASDRVKVHYRGTLIDGTEFDSSYARNEPAEFPVNAVIAGWTEALQIMPVGSKYQLFIPSDLAYGASPRPKIPANSVLIFDVEVLDVIASAKSPEKKSAPKKK